MGGIMPKAPDNSAQIAALNKEQAEAERRRKDELSKRNRELQALRQRQYGRQSLIQNTGGELGVKDTLGE